MHSTYECTYPPTWHPTLRVWSHALRMFKLEHEHVTECWDTVDTSQGFGWNICTASQSTNVHVCWDLHSELSHIYMPVSQQRVCVTFSWLEHAKPQAVERPENSRAVTPLYVSTVGDMDRLSTCLTFHTFLCYSWAHIWCFKAWLLLRWRFRQ